jgi:tetratricopeptide (TPR) repeat protein
VKRLRRLIEEQRFSEVRAAAEALLVTVPENRDALYACAHAQRRLGDIPAALETLSRLQRLHSRFSRSYQERGFCHVALRQAPEAIEVFRRAVSISPALPVSWGMLEGLYGMTGQAAEAAHAAAQAAGLRELPREIVTAGALFSDGELGQAEELIRGFLVKHGHQIEAMRLLAHSASGHLNELSKSGQQRSEVIGAGQEARVKGQCLPPVLWIACRRRPGFASGDRCSCNPFHVFHVL